MTVSPGDSEGLQLGNDVVLFVSNRLDDPNNHCNVIGVWLAEGMPTGKWVLELSSSNGREVDYHAWVERSDRAQSVFVQPIESHTLGSISNGHLSIVVGSHDAHKDSIPLSSFSSSGPTRDGRNKPELTAPGQNVMAAHSGSKTGLTRKSGTSMAAPAVTGLVALMLGEAKRTGTSLDIHTIRQKLITGLDRNSIGSWDQREGAGRAHSRSI
jgi:subtilisin family serine protease